jgi:predicted transglutaminase-like cysteine proteinase
MTVEASKSSRQGCSEAAWNRTLRHYLSMAYLLYKKVYPMSAIARILNQSAMCHGGSFWAILASAWVGPLLAGAVYTLEPLKLPTDSPPPMTYLANGFEAASFVEDGTNAATAPSKPTERNDEQAAQLFGMNTEPVAAGELQEKWHQVEAAMAQDFAVVAQCRANGTCPVAAQRLIDISAKGAGRSGRARVGLINRAADLAISPVSDEMQWGVADHWSDPFETLLSNRGDCEDYAIVKYAALLEAGIPKDDVKIVILKNFFPNENHAAVATRVDGQWLMLDNRTLTLVRDTEVTRAIPEFVLDHEGVKRFKWENQNRRVGS